MPREEVASPFEDTVVLMLAQAIRKRERRRQRSAGVTEPRTQPSTSMDGSPVARKFWPRSEVWIPHSPRQLVSCSPSAQVGQNEEIEEGRV
jgi:hypothetical protein